MVISDRYNYLFILTPHTGSTALRAELETCYGARRVPSARKHAQLDEHPELEHAPDGRRRFVFCGVRNPLDIWVTRYHRLRSNHDNLFTNPALWSENGGWISRRKRAEFAFVHDAGRSFSDYVRAFPTTLQKLARRRMNGVDGRIRFENLQVDFARALDSLGLRPAREVPSRNRTRGKGDYLEHYCPEARAIARQQLGPMMESWGYEFPAGF